MAHVSETTRWEIVNRRDLNHQKNSAIARETNVPIQTVRRILRLHDSTGSVHECEHPGHLLPANHHVVDN